MKKRNPKENRNQPAPTTTLTCSHTNSRKEDKHKIVTVSGSVIILRRKRCLDCNQCFRTVEMIGDIDPKIFSEYLLGLITVHINHSSNNCLGWLWEYSLQRVREHLRSQLPKGVSLKQIGKTHRIAHIKPLSDFGYPFPDDPQFHLAWSLVNLTVRPVA